MGSAEIHNGRNELVSIVIPTYNRATLIGRTLESVFNQTYEHFEVLIVDDHSRDDTEQVVSAVTDLRINYIRHTENRGAPAARNTGIRAAKGEFVAFLDSDDTWLPEKLEKQLTVMRESPFRPALVYTGITLVNARGEVRYVHTPDKTWRGHVYEKMLGENLAGSTSTALVRKECFGVAGLFDETLHARQDYDLWLRISKHYAIDFVPEPLIFQFEHDEGRITSNLAARIQGRTVIFDKISSDLQKHPAKLARYHYETGALHFDDGNIALGRQYMRESIQQYPLPKAIALLSLSFINRGALRQVRDFSRKALTQRLKAAAPTRKDESEM